MEAVKKLDFSGHHIYCGLDVHKKDWKVTIRTDQMELKTFSQPPSVKALSHFLRHSYPCAQYEAVYEAGFCGFEIQRGLQKEGINCIVVNAADVPTMDKEKQQKTDVIDSRKLSKSLSAGMLHSIFIPSIQQQDDRCIMRNYHQFIKDQTRYKNRIKGWLYFQGIDLAVKGYWSKNYIEQIKKIELTTNAARTSLDLLIDGYLVTKAQVLHATRALRSLSREERYLSQVELIRSIPGIGEIHAMLFLTEIGDINCFKSFDQLCSYIGLIPSMHSSGVTEVAARLTYRTNSKLKSALIEASWTAIGQDPAMTLAFSEYAKKMKKNRAIIKIARKLLNRIRYVLKNQMKYETGIVI